VLYSERNAATVGNCDCSRFIEHRDEPRGAESTSTLSRQGDTEGLVAAERKVKSEGNGLFATRPSLYEFIQNVSLLWVYHKKTKKWKTVARALEVFVWWLVGHSSNCIGRANEVKLRRAPNYLHTLTLCLYHLSASVSKDIIRLYIQGGPKKVSHYDYSSLNRIKTPQLWLDFSPVSIIKWA